MSLPSKAAAEEPREILVIKPSSLGDIVHTLPSVALLRRRFPAAKIRWLVNTEWQPLLEGNRHVDEVLEFPRRHFRGVGALFRIGPWARKLKQRTEADLIVDYQGLLRSAMIAKLCRGAEGRVVGLSDAREGARFFYDAVADVKGIAHAVDRYLALTGMVTGTAAAAMGSLEWPLPDGSPPPGFDHREPFVVLHPFSRGAGKSLSVDQVTEFCRALEPVPIVLAGRADVSTPLPGRPHVIDLLNQTSLPELIWLLRHARFVVSVDSGPMHIAAALTPHLVSIHTWSDPAKVGPYRSDAWVWKDGRLFQQRDRENSAAHREVANFTSLAEFVRTQL